VAATLDPTFFAPLPSATDATPVDESPDDPPHAPKLGGP